MSRKKSTHCTYRQKIVEIKYKGGICMMKNVEIWYTLEEVVEKRKMMLDGIDNFVEYIDNYRLYCEAKKANDRIRQDVKKIDKVISEMKEIFVELCEKRKLNVKIAYARGVIRVEYEGKMYYRKIRA